MTSVKVDKLAVIPWPLESSAARARLRNYAHTRSLCCEVSSQLKSLLKARVSSNNSAEGSEWMCEDGGEPELCPEGGGVPLVLLPHLSPESRVPVRPAGPLRPYRAPLHRLLPGGLGPQGLPLPPGCGDQSQ